MAYSRRLGVIGILGVCFFVAVGCDDSDDKKANDDAEAGENAGGSAGSGGKSTGGSQNNAGKGGKATGGSAGSATAGTGGTVNGGGEGGGAGESVGGVGESVGGVGGEGNSSPIGGAGADGGGGEPGGGAGGAPVAVFTQCTSACQIDADCSIDGDETLKCDPAAKECFDPAQVCETNEDCIQPLAGWFPCESPAGCFEGTNCVEWRGAGYCVPIAEGPDPDCGFDVLMTLPIFGDDGDQAVCVTDDPRCGADDRCFMGCGAFGCEGLGTCNEATGQCECTDGADCTSTGVCGADKRCTECNTSAQCASNSGGNKACIDGRCGCDTATTCPDYGWANATPVCE
jgi:hypothetical protein